MKTDETASTVANVIEMIFFICFVLCWFLWVYAFPGFPRRKAGLEGEIVFGEIIDVQHKMPGFSESSSSRCWVRRLRGTKKAAPKGGV
jgi:hypothetical protein